MPRDWVVAGMGDGVVHAERNAATDDVGLGHVRERGVDFEAMIVVGLDAGFGAEVGGALEGGDELGAAVGVAGVVDRVHADEDV